MAESIKTLVIDDDQFEYQMISKLLMQNDNYAFEPQWARCSKTAAAALYQHEFELIICDYKLDRETGLELIKQLEHLLVDQTTHIAKPIIMLTGDNSQEVVIEALRANVSDFMNKNSLSHASIMRAGLNAVEKFRLRTVLAKSNLSLKERNEELAKRSDELKQFYHIVSHELKTPLTAAREFINMTHDGTAGSINEQQREFLTIAERNLDRMANQLNDLLDANKLDSGKYILKRGTHPIDEILKEAIEFVAGQIREKNIEVSIDNTLGHRALFVDRERLIQVLGNLLDNAIRHSDQHGHITINCKPHVHNGDCCYIEVADQGCGIPEDQLDHIFDALYQADTAGYSTSGRLGLGLFIANEIIKQHEGSISVHSRVGQGTHFQIKLPLQYQRKGESE